MRLLSGETNLTPKKGIGFGALERMSTDDERSMRFSEGNLDSTLDVLGRNVSTKSDILCPFNTSKTHLSAELHDSVTDILFDKAEVMRLAARMKDLDRDYERNYNDKMDNGVFNHE